MMSLLAVWHCEVNIYTTDLISFIYLFCRRISGWSSFWRMSRSLAKSWRELSERYPSRRTTVLGTTVATERIRWPPPSSSVWSQLMPAPCSWRDRSGPARPSLFSVFALRLHISLAHSRVGPPPPLGFATPKPVFLNQPEPTRSGMRLS